MPLGSCWPGLVCFGVLTQAPPSARPTTCSLPSLKGDAVPLSSHRQGAAEKIPEPIKEATALFYGKQGMGSGGPQIPKNVNRAPPPQCSSGLTTQQAYPTDP